MPVEVSLVIGYLAAWAVAKARRTLDGLDRVADSAMDAALERLDGLVRRKLSGHPALVDLDAEVTENTAEGDDEAVADKPISDLTREQLELSLWAALQKDPEFGQQLGALVRELRPAETDSSPRTSMTVHASGHSRVYQAGRDMEIDRS